MISINRKETDQEILIEEDVFRMILNCAHADLINSGYRNMTETEIAALLVILDIKHQYEYYPRKVT